MADQLNIDWLSTSQDIESQPDITPTVVENVDELTIAQECDKIEKLANQEYFMNKSWSEDVKAHLREYSMACGVSKIIEVQPQSIKQVASTVKNTTLVKTASTKTLDIGDPFKLDEKLNAPERGHNDWQEIRKQSNLKDRPSLDIGIVPIRGGENTNIQNEPKLAQNQNSLYDHDRIEKLINSTELDNGARLAQEKKEKEELKIANKEKWEQDKIKAMEKLDIVSKGLVFPTEALNANPGTNSALSKRISNNFNPDLVEEKTLGEQLKEIMMEKNAGIKRQETKDRSWDAVQENKSARDISDEFTNSLKKALKKG